MPEKMPGLNQEKEIKLNIISEQEYFNTCIQYALSGGWVKETEKDILINRYLKPIYNKYLEIIEDLRKEGTPENELAKIVIKMNSCLESTRRIGSTDPINIIRTVDDLKRRSQDQYTEYALVLLADFISEVVSS